jgi:probable rRNA maturation factor
MAIDLVFEDVTSFSLDEESLCTSIDRVVSDYGFISGDITLVFCSDAFILDANKQFLNHDYYTDIITFDYCEGDVVSGDLLISVDTVLSNSELYNTVYKEELFRVVLHGVLHLCGLGDKSEEDVVLMRAAENKYLSLFVNPF